MYCIINTNTSLASSISQPVVVNRGVSEFSASIKAREFIKLSSKDLSLITGKKMNLWDRLSFSLLKMKMRHDLKKNPNLAMADYYSETGKRHLGTVWIVLITIISVILILFIALLIAYGRERP